MQPRPRPFVRPPSGLGRSSRSVRPARPGFSLVELLVVVGILVILLSIFVPYVAKMRETSRRVGCANNLRGVHAALSRYADANGHEFPRAAGDPDRPGAYVAFTGADRDPAAAAGPAATTGSTAAQPNSQVAPGVAAAPPAPPPVAAPGPTPPTTTPTTRSTRPFNRPPAGAVQFNDVTASLWLVVGLGYAGPEQFVCPSGGQTPDPLLTGGVRVPAARRSNFTAGRHLSYSYASPFSGNPRFRLNTDVLPPDFAILADKNPGAGGKGGDVAGPAYDAPRERYAEANSRSHGRAGQNVLYATGVVEFQSTPYCGYGPPREPTSIYRDNIYTARSITPLAGDTVPTDLATNGVCTPAAGPAWVYDSYLVPTDGE